MAATQSPRPKVHSRPGSCSTTKLPVLSVGSATASRPFSKGLFLCETAICPLEMKKRPLRTNLRIGVSNCSTRSSSRSSTGRLHKSGTQSLLDGYISVLPPAVSAKAWAITDGCSGTLLYGSHENDPRLVASLTKIMTVYTCLKLAKSRPEVSLDLVIPVSAKAAAAIGTRAGLWMGDEITVRNLLYGVMLPSGNDAALCLAEGIGAVLQAAKGPNPIETSPEQTYLCQMAKFAAELGLSHSHFRNPTGLDYNGNLSSARDINQIATAAMRFGSFRTIVRSQEHCFSLKGSNGQKRNMRWLNTNKLLNVGFDGLKTGVTPAAGPCLCASLHSQAGYVIVTVLHCKSMEDRWAEVQSLTTWAQVALLCR